MVIQVLLLTQFNTDCSMAPLKGGLLLITLITLFNLLNMCLGHKCQLDSNPGLNQNVDQLCNKEKEMSKLRAKILTDYLSGIGYQGKVCDSSF